MVTYTQTMRNQVKPREIPIEIVKNCAESPKHSKSRNIKNVQVRTYKINQNHHESAIDSRKLIEPLWSVLSRISHNSASAERGSKALAGRGAFRASSVLWNLSSASFPTVRNFVFDLLFTKHPSHAMLHRKHLRFHLISSESQTQNHRH